MHRNLPDILQRLITRPDGSSRFTRVNVVLIGLIVVLAGIVPAFAVTSDGADSSTTSSSTSTTVAAPVVVGKTDAAATEASTPADETAVAATTATTAAPAPTTTAPAATTTTTAPKSEEVVEGDLAPSGNTAQLASLVSGPSEVVPNPGWPVKCNANIAMLLDRSSSIGDPQYGGNFQNTVSVKNDAYAFIRALGGKADGPRLYINAFATNVKPVYQLWGGGFADIPATTNPYTGGSVDKAVMSVGYTPFASPQLIGYDDYGTRPAPSVGLGRTNWQGAMAAIPAGANLVIMITDGEPTWWNGANPATNNGATQPDDVLQAVAQANAIKRAGTRVVAVHVGQERGPWQTNLAAISGPAQNSDYFVTDYAGLNKVLMQIADAACPKAAASIAIDKTADKTAARPGDKVNYSFKVTNTGDETLAPVVVTDNVIGPIGQIASLAPGASQTLTKEYTVPANQTANVVNTATAEGTTPAGSKVSATDNHTLNVITLKVEKSADKPSAIAAEEVTYSFKVTNTSAVTLTNILVEDDVLGEVGTIPSLAAGANSTLTKKYLVPAGSGPIVNTVTACALVPGSTTDKACATDKHTLPRLSIGLTKTANTQLASVGETITYTYIVTNTSGVTLSNLALTDDKLGKITLPVTTLAAGASTTGTAQYVVKATDTAPTNASGQIVNVATVTGTAPDGTTVKATAQATVGVVAGTVVSTTPTPQVKGEALAYTGAGTTSLFTLALMLLTVGGALLVLTKVRRRSAMDGNRA